MKCFKGLPTFLIFNFLLLSCFTPAQTNQDNRPVDNIFSAERYEAAVFSYLNKLRKDPSGFYHKYVKDYVNQKSDWFTPHYTNSLKKTLLNSSPLPPFKTNSILETLAKKQLHYLVHDLKGKRLTHNQGNISFAERIKGTNLHCFAENLYRFPKASPLEVILDLLVDQGVSSLGHRKNMLNPKYRLVGIETAIAPNKYKVTVMDFGCEK